MKKKKTTPAPAPNPFTIADDIYLTPNKIAVTKSTNRKTPRGFTKVTKTKYYAQNDSNIRKLKKAKGNTVRVGRTGTNYKGI